ncbi:hypothetical protein D3C80_1884420 [compost metagenome]
MLQGKRTLCNVAGHFRPFSYPAGDQLDIGLYLMDRCRHLLGGSRRLLHACG